MLNPPPAPTRNNETLTENMCDRPPILIVSVERDIGTITTWTGNIPGVGLMLVIPAMLAIRSKRQFPEQSTGNLVHRSPFANIGCVLALSAVCRRSAR